MIFEDEKMMGSKRGLRRGSWKARLSNLCYAVDIKCLGQPCGDFHALKNPCRDFHAVESRAVKDDALTSML